ncbi:MAG: response regulator [Luteitalea sp.]|nr:response regulator [Luteitalea sp.]
MRVLIVEDEEDLASAVKRLLADAGFSADVAYDGEEGLYLALETPYDLVVLDLMLPRLQGERLLGELRARDQHVPVLILTARDAVTDRVRLLDSGADDYLIKPFEGAELVSRCRALVRRASGQSAPVLVIGEMEIDMPRRRVRRAGVDIALTPREFHVLEYLALHRGRVVSRSELLDHLYGEAEETMSNVLEVFVAGLRRKLGADVVQTRRGHGYIVEA